jgi:hypothetical protein
MKISAERMFSAPLNMMNSVNHLRLDSSVTVLCLALLPLYCLCGNCSGKPPYSHALYPAVLVPVVCAPTAKLPLFLAVQQVVAQIPWGHQVRLLDQVKDPGERDWYVRATIQHGWSRDVLVHQIATGLRRRSGKAVTNFETTLPPLQSDLAQQITKDPYTFEAFEGATPAQHALHGNYSLSICRV